MNKRIIIILAAIASISAGLAGWSIVERRASTRLLEKLALAKPGVHLSHIRERLGPQMRECSQLEDVMLWGSVKDASFCRGKKLLWFYAATPPCRAIEVYTDANDVVVFATWRQL